MSNAYREQLGEIKTAHTSTIDLRLRLIQYWEATPRVNVSIWWGDTMQSGISINEDGIDDLITMLQYAKLRISNERS